MKNSNFSREIEPQKEFAEKLNGYAAILGVIALVGAYAATGQIVPGYI